MGLFSDMGERFERAKRSIMDGDEAPYVCGACEEGLSQSYDTCPHCGEAAVEPVESDEPEE